MRTPVLLIESHVAFKNVLVEGNLYIITSNFISQRTVLCVLDDYPNVNDAGMLQPCFRIFTANLHL